MNRVFLNRRKMRFRRRDPNRVLRIRPAKLNFIFPPVRFGLKPQVKMVP